MKQEIGMELSPPIKKSSQEIKGNEDKTSAIPSANEARSGAGELNAAPPWTLVTESLPKPGKFVLAFFRYTTGKGRVIRAMHAPYKTLSEDDYGEFEDGADYDETSDMFFWPEGWYETNECEETNWKVPEDVTHWMPLPAHPNTQDTDTPASGGTD